VTGPVISFELPPITSYQRDAIFCPERFSIIEATTKAGKTVGCIYWHLYEAINTGAPGREFWWVAPVYPQAEIAYRRMKLSLKQADTEGSTWRANDSKLSITLAHGGVVRFKSGEKPDNLYGEDVYAVVIDESTRVREEAWHAVLTTLTATNGKCRIIGNVKGRNNWAYKLARRAESGRKDWHYAKITAADAVREGILDQDVIDEAEATLPEHVFRELFYGEPSDDGGNPFGLQHIGACVQPMSDKPAVAYGLDVAKKQDWFVLIGMDEDCNVCSFHRWQHVPYPQCATRVADIVGDKPVLVDSTGVGDAFLDLLVALGLMVEGYVFSSPSKQRLMEFLAVEIQGETIGFPDNEIRRELDTFEYELTRTNTKYSAPDGLHDDCVCSLALAAWHNKHMQPVSAVAIGDTEGDQGDDPRGFFQRARSDPDWGF